MKRASFLLAVLLIGYLLYKGLCFRAIYLAVLEKTCFDALPAMIDALDDKSEPVRGVCIGYFGRRGPQAIRPLVEALNDRSPRRREGAALSLRAVALRHRKSVAELKRELVSALARAIHDENPTVRVSAAIALWHVDRPSKEALSVLIASCKEHNREARYYAFHWLEEIGPDAKEAVPALIEELNDTDELVRLRAGNTLREIDPQTASTLGVP